MKLYHYTSLEAALNIIGGNSICFYGGRYDCMNDPTDFIFARDIIMPYLKEKYTADVFDNAIKPYPYIVSFCKSKDDPLMWRLYNAEVALVLDTDKLPFDEWDDWNEKKVNDICMHQEVLYTIKEDVPSVADYLNVNAVHFCNNEVDNFMMNAIPFIKHKSYKVENEYRFVKYDYDSFTTNYNDKAADNYDEYDGEIVSDVYVRDVKNGDLRLYREFHLPKDSLIGIIVHTYDMQKFESIKNHLVLFLQTKNITLQDVNIMPTAAYPSR